MDFTVEQVDRLAATRDAVGLARALRFGRDRDLVLAAHFELARLGADAVPPLIEFMRDDLTSRSQRAWWTLIRIGAPSAAPLADLARHDPIPWVRGAATWVLAFIKNRSVEPTLIAGLRDPANEVRLPAAIALGNRSCHDAVGALLHILTCGAHDDPSFPHPDHLKFPFTRACTGGRGDEGGPLDGGAGDSRCTALLHTPTSGLPPLEPLSPADAAELLLAARTDNRLNEDDEDEDDGYLGHEVPDEYAPRWLTVPWCSWEASEVRGATALALGRIGDARAVEPLIACLEDAGETASLRNWIIEALWMIGDRRAFDAVYEATFDEDLADAALSALGSFGDRRALARVAPLVNSRRWGARHIAVWALSGMEDPAALRYLLRLADDSDAAICRQAAVGLARIGSQQALEGVASLLAHRDLAVRLKAARLLQRAESLRTRGKC